MNANVPVMALFILCIAVASVSARPAPDLAILTFAPPSGQVDGKFSLLYAVGNVGDATSEGFTVNFTISNDAFFTPKDTVIGTRIMKALAPGTATPVLNTTVTVPESVPNGWYYIRMDIDVTNAVEESNETNNVRVAPDMICVGVPPPCDLLARDFAWDAGTNVARTLQLRYTFSNIGMESTGPFTFGFYLSTDTAITTADFPIADLYCVNLSYENTMPMTYYAVTVPPSVPPGWYYVGMILDTGNTVAETDEGNNAITTGGKFAVSDLPDMACLVLGIPTIVVDRTFPVQHAVRNYGVTPSGPFSVEFYLSTDTTITTSDTLIGTRSYTDLAPLSVAPYENATVTIPPEVPPGTYYMGMIADSGNAVAEAIETNNVVNTWGTISVLRAPDIAASTFAPLPGSPGQVLSIQNAVINFGDASTGPFSVAFFLSDDATITTSDLLIGMRNYTDLAPSSIGSTETTNATVPMSIPAGAYYLGMIADPWNAVPERNEGNNATFCPTQISISGTLIPTPPGLLMVPGGSDVPHDLDLNGEYEDVNGNGRRDFADVVLFFNQMGWIAANEPITAFDYNGNGRIDFADVVWLFTNL